MSSFLNVGGRSCIQRHHLHLYQNPLRFREVDEAVVEAALNNMRGRTPYLKSQTVLFCLASEAVNADNWADVASTLLTRPDDPETEESAADSAASVIDHQTRLSYLVDGRSWLLFQLLGVDTSYWLKQPVGKWKEDAGFLAYQRFIKGLRATNDTAERGIALIKRFVRAAKDDA